MYKRQAQILSSNIGNRFMVNNDFQRSISKVEVYAMNGGLIYSGGVNSNLVWDASRERAGIYVIRIWTESERYTSQRVVVKH